MSDFDKCKQRMLEEIFKDKKIELTADDFENKFNELDSMPLSDKLREKVINMIRQSDQQELIAVLGIKKKLVSDQANDADRVKKLEEVLTSLLKSLPTIEQHAKSSMYRSANSPSAHQEFVAEDRADLRKYEEAKAKAQAALGEGA